jgi:hypothetical protein
MSELHPLVDVDNRSAPLARFYAEPVTITTADRQVAGIVVDVWRWFTGDATGVRVDNGDHLVLPDDQEWTITHRDGQKHTATTALGTRSRAQQESGKGMQIRR